MWENYIYSCSSPGLFEYHSVVLIQSWPFIEYTVCSDIAVKDDVLTVMFLVELHNRLLISHVKCRGAYLLRLFDILHICRSVFFFFSRKCLRKRAAALEAKPAWILQAGEERAIMAFITLFSPVLFGHFNIYIPIVC